MWWWLLACQRDAYDAPEGAVTLDYAVDGPLTTFPDDAHTRDSERSYTGVCVHFEDGARASLDADIPDSVNLIEALETLDGFGVNGAIEIVFTDAVDPASFSPTLWDLDAGVQIPVYVEWTSDARRAIVQPGVPLREGVLHGLVASDVRAADGTDVWASRDLWELLHGDDGVEREDDRAAAVLRRLVPRYTTLVQVADTDPDAIDAATVFTTQTVVRQDEALVARIGGIDAAVRQLECATDGAGFLRCDGLLRAVDVLGRAGVIASEPSAQLASPPLPYDVPMTVWLPPDRTGPLPLVIYGHGLGGDRGEAGGYAHDVGDVGFAVAAVDAPFQGDHPRATHSGTLLTTLDFFGVDFANAGMDVLALRDHFRLAAYDKRQLLHALLARRDVDGDGIDDLDGRVGYAGHSQGALMGVQFLAQVPEVQAAELSCGGGRVSQIVQYGSDFSVLVGGMSPDGTNEDDLRRFFPLLQAAIDRGDPASYATSALGPDVSLQMVVDDGTVPNMTSEYLARALRVQLAPPVLREIPGVDVLPALPASGNDDGRTATIFEFAQMYDGDGSTLVPATHYDIHRNPASLPQIREFWRSTWEDGSAVVIDPWTAEP